MTIQRVRKAVFPVAGLGTRFLPATKSMPKEMLIVVDKPLIQYAVENALEAGCGRRSRVPSAHADAAPACQYHPGLARDHRTSAVVSLVSASV